MNYTSLFFFMTVLFSGPLTGSLAPFTDLFKQNNTIDISKASTTIDKQLTILEKEKISTDIVKKYEHDLKKIDSDQVVLKERIAKLYGEQKELGQKELSLLNQMQQVVTEIIQKVEQIANVSEQHIKLLQEYKADPDFQSLKVPDKAAYNFDDLQDIERRILEVHNKLADLEKKKNNAQEDLTKRRKTVAVIQEEFKEKQRQQKNFSTSNHSSLQGEIIDAEKQLLTYRQELTELKVKELEVTSAFIGTQLFVAQKQLEVLMQEQARLKRTLRVDNTCVQEAEGALEARRQELNVFQETVTAKLAILNTTKETIKKEYDQLLQRYDISASDAAIQRVWTKDPHTMFEWATTALIGENAAHEALIDAEREYLELQITLEKSKLRYEEINTATIRSWNKITQRKFSTNSHVEIEREIKSYEAPRVEIQADLSAMQDKRTTKLNELHTLNLSLERIKAIIGMLEKHHSVFKNYESDYQEVRRLCIKTEDYIRKRIDVTARLVDDYSKIIATLSDTLKKIEIIVAELNARSFWKRSEQSIELRELQHFLPDIRHFIDDIFATGKLYAHLIYTRAWASLFVTYKGKTTEDIILLIIKLLGLCLLYMLLRLILPWIQRIFFTESDEVPLRSPRRLFLNMLVQFIRRYLGFFFVWLVGVGIVEFNFINPFFCILFYLASIPLLLFLAHRFFEMLIEVNERRGYLFITQSYLHRFLLIVPTLVYATIVIAFFREAFILGNYHESQVPAILIAVNFILLQIALISLIGKEQILSIIPTRTPLWEWVKELVSRYYYVFVVCAIAIIIMSNPYVGYGRQVLYILKRFVLTLLLIPLFSWAHAKIKSITSSIFFYYSDTEVLKERFSAGKTWYGFFVVASFFVFIGLGILIFAAVWDQPIGVHDFMNWLQVNLYSPGIDELTGKPISVTALSLLKIIAFVLGGVLLTYILNYFVLRTLFDPFLVGIGIQNTVSTVLRYVIIIVALLIGLNNAGLNSMAYQFFAVLLALGFALREPVADFISYFIILVQRPIKIGDLIMVDTNEVKGVVRHITPRSVLIRKNNSVTLVVPNSHIITKPLVNWSYSRSFVAFDDISVTVTYTADPVLVKQLIFKAIDSNTSLLKNPAPVIRLENFADNGYQFLVRAFLPADKVLDQWDIASQVRFDIVRLLKENGLRVASPTRLIKILPDSEEFRQGS